MLFVRQTSRLQESFEHILGQGKDPNRIIGLGILNLGRLLVHGFTGQAMTRELQHGPTVNIPAEKAVCTDRHYLPIIQCCKQALGHCNVNARSYVVCKVFDSIQKC